MDLSNARPAILAAGQALAEALTRHDADAAAALYTEDGVVMPPDAPPMAGRAAIAAFWRQAVAALGLKAARLVTLEVHSAGNLATEIGEATLDLAAATAKVKFIVLWRRDGDGVWRLHRDIWNGSPG